MALLTVPLQDGLKVNGEPQLQAELRQLEAGDIIAASEESEKLFVHGGDPVLVVSPSLMGINTLRRQIASIGSIPGPLEMSMMNKLSPADLDLLQTAADKLDKAVLEDVSKRGRSDPPQSDDD